VADRSLTILAALAGGQLRRHPGPIQSVDDASSDRRWLWVLPHPLRLVDDSAMSETRVETGASMTSRE